MTRLLAAIVIVGSAVIALVLAWPQLFGLAGMPGVAQIVALRGLGIAVALVLAVGLTILALLAAPARRFAASLAAVALAFALVNAAVLSVRGFGDFAFTTKGDSDVTVLSWNTLGDAPGAEEIARLALESEADIIALPETTNELGIDIALLMQAADRPMWVHTLAYDQESKARSTTLLVSVDLGEYSVDTATRTTAVLPTLVAAPVDGSGPTIVVVHTVAPLPPMEATWQQDLRWVADACDGENVILAGDFNATLDHITGLGVDGGDLGSCRDAALATDNAAVGTWPTQLPALLGSPIDHVMATPNWTVTGMRVIESLDKAGSDHRPILVQLSPAD
ncbi:endonuclease/exonuclease/phosphatase family protein [Salinibacterium soli]|uniref:Endonuclease/exonuclease/phosphatase family protein n=1 Tax=Antiquaquibacter soli TaxID=3064523 RepID=A0ABT9BLL0_9MICO|nr:endonuclease/exonuclease/phosphatase family protein [Protaetiibacter sp. WY-16]MDO7881332.1 endonuclease/exonuclease/phosphatase family protein [Protaetiibacter sp. WY-16]